MAEGKYVELPDLLVEVNAHVHEVAERFGGGASSSDQYEWDFLCECGKPECGQRVLLSLAEYEALKRAGGSVLASGHRLSRSQTLRDNARELVTEAKALQAQARHQSTRARRNLAASRG